VGAAVTGVCTCMRGTACDTRHGVHVVSGVCRHSVCRGCERPLYRVTLRCTQCSKKAAVCACCGLQRWSGCQLQVTVPCSTGVFVFQLRCNCNIGAL
jgi:hypothetical protein